MCLMVRPTFFFVFSCYSFELRFFGKILASLLYWYWPCRKFVVELLSTYIRKFCSVKRFRPSVKVILDSNFRWSLFKGILTHGTFYNERFKNVWRLQKQTEKSFEPFFFISRTVFDDEKNSFRKRVNGVKGGFNLHLSNQCRILWAFAWLLFALTNTPN